MNYLLSDFQLSAKANFFESCPDLSLRVITAMEARGNGRKRERNVKVSHFSNKKKTGPLREQQIYTYTSDRKSKMCLESQTSSVKSGKMGDGAGSEEVVRETVLIILTARCPTRLKNDTC